MANITAHEQACFAVPEVTFGTAVSPAATDAMRVTELVLTPQDAMTQRNDLRPGSRSMETQTKGKREVTGSFSMDDAPSGAVGTKPDNYALIDTIYTATTNTASFTVAASPAPSTTGATVDAVTNLAVNDLITVPCLDANGDSVDRVVVLTDISTLALTWKPALPSAPVEGAVIRSGVQYTLGVNNTASATVYKMLGIDGTALTADQVYCGAGVIVPSITWEGSGDGLVTVSGDLVAKDVAAFYILGLDATVDDSETAWDVDDLNGTAIYTAGRCVYIIDSEQVVVTNTTDDTQDSVTVTRAYGGTSGAAHDASDTMTPYYPGSTVGGTEMAGISGMVNLGGTAYHITTWSIAHTEGSELRNDQFGSPTAAGKKNAAIREVKPSISGYLLKDEDRIALAAGKVQTYVLVQAGEQQGHIHAFYLPAVEFDIPEVNAAKGEEFALALEGVAIAPTGYPETEFRHAYL